MNNNSLILIIQSLATQAPAILAVFAACIVIIVNWQREPKASMLALLGFGSLLVSSIVAIVVTILLQRQFLPAGGDMNKLRTFGQISAFLGVFWSFARAGSYVLILVAVYAGRPVQSSVIRYPQPPK